jgi:hypothetical protein
MPDVEEPRIVQGPLRSDSFCPPRNRRNVALRPGKKNLVGGIMKQ